MKFVANYYIWSKYYITFCHVVANGKRGSQQLARAIADCRDYLEKNIKNGYSFLMRTIICPSFIPTSQTSLSLSCTSNTLQISEGIVVRNDLDLGFC